MADDTNKNKELEKTSDVKKGRNGKILKILLIPIILVVQAGVAYFVVVNYLIGKPENPQSKPSKQHNQEVGQFLEIKDIVVNPAGTLGRRFLVAEMGLETHNPDLIEEAETKRIWIRDAVLSFLREQTSEELLDLSKREALKAKLLQVVNKKLTKAKFEKLYFTKYIMQ
ncbi:MAG: flagellar basal body-associated protein FliL [bacterium]